MTRTSRLLLVLVAALLVSSAAAVRAQGPFTLPQVLGAPFPTELVSSRAAPAFAWVFDQRGVRNIFIAEGPAFAPRQLTAYTDDDGQELTNLSFSPDGRYVVYVRGGDHGSNWDAAGNLMPDPASSPVQPKMQIWSVAAAGGSPVLIGEGDLPVIAPQRDRVLLERDHQIFAAPIDGSRAPERLFFARGTSESPVFSPDGARLAFVSSRGDHSFIAIYENAATPIRYLAPSSARDGSPCWSPDGTSIAFVRRPGQGGPAGPLLEARPQPWAIWVADVSTGAAREIWASPVTLRGSFPRVQGGANLRWAAGGRLVYLSYEDGWPHLYSVPAGGGAPLKLTDGAFQVEDVALTPDRHAIVYNANTGETPGDLDRRHLFTVPVDRAAPVALTRGETIDWAPAVSSDGATVAFFSSTPRRPGLPMVMPLAGGAGRSIADAMLPADFPTAALVVPEAVTFTAADGTTVHGQIFKTAAGAAKRPAVVFVHGGPPRQMLLGWHYMYYYANSYAMNQYLASRGYIVLSVNYRLGIGYGFEFHQPAHAGARGASEYPDVLAGGTYLQARADVDPARIGIWGGSYGGFLTALALGRNSDVFKAGVDLHGVHTRVSAVSPDLMSAAQVGDGVSAADVHEALRVAWDSSPIAAVPTWRSPVLLIHGDDDRNVEFSQTVDLVQRLKAKGVTFEELVFPDEIHDFLLYRNWRAAWEAAADFFDRTLK